MTIAQRINLFVQKELKYGAILADQNAITLLTNAVPALEAIVAAQAPATATQLLGEVEKAVSSVLSVVDAAAVNDVLAASAAELIASLQGDIEAYVAPYVAKVIGALQANVEKLQADIDALNAQLG